MSIEPGTHFTVLRDFFCEELQSQYVERLHYTVREDDNVLAELVPIWIDEGKVRILTDDGGMHTRPASVGGAGWVT